LNTLDQHQDSLAGEMMMQAMYNHHAMDIMAPDVRQLFFQMRDAKMQHITQLQQQIQQMMQQGMQQ
jgi:rubrerythrin